MLKIIILQLVIIYTVSESDGWSLCYHATQNIKTDLEFIEKEEIKSNKAANFWRCQLDAGNEIDPLICVCPRLVAFSGLPVAAVLAAGVRGTRQQGRESMRGRRRGRCDGDETERKPPAVQLCSPTTLDTLPLYPRSTGTSMDHEMLLFGLCRVAHERSKINIFTSCSIYEFMNWD